MSKVRIIVDSDSTGRHRVMASGWNAERISQVGPALEDADMARYVAACLARALREVKVPLVPVLTIADADSLFQAIEFEAEMTMDAWYDDKEPDPGTLTWVETVRSIGVPSVDGQMPLDFDQALAVVDVITAALETAEEIDEEDTGIGPTPEQLRVYARQLMAAGFPVEFTGAEGYSIRVTGYTNVPYDTLYEGTKLRTAVTLAEAHNAIREHRAGIRLESEVQS